MEETMTPVIPFRLVEFWSLLGCGLVTLATLWVIDSPRTEAWSPQAADAIPSKSRALDHELAQVRLLHRELDSVMEQLKKRSLSLDEGARLAEKAVDSIHPKFLAFAETNFRGRTEKQTLAHLLVKRAIGRWGIPARNAKTAQLIHEYDALFPGDTRAQADLREFIEWYTARPRNHTPGWGGGAVV